MTNSVVTCTVKVEIKICLYLQVTADREGHSSNVKELKVYSDTSGRNRFW